jgi:glucose-fructose oxidoreductase
MGDFTRRDFLRSLGFGAVAFTTAFDRSIAQALEANNGKPLGVALLGLGRYSTGQLGPALRETKLCRLTGVITGTPAKGEKWASEYNLDKKNIYDYTTMDRIADNREIDIVYVVTPPAIHPEYTIRAAKLGKHVISEKPMAASVSDCDRMIKACSDAKVQLGIGYRLHYDPYHLEMMRIAKSQEYGRFVKMDGKFAYVLGQREHRTSKALGGGPLMDLGIYVIHGACMAANADPIAVTAKESKKEKPELFNEVEETMTWEMEFPKGERATGYTSFNGRGNSLRLDGEKGWLDFKSAFSYRGIGCDTSRGAMNYAQVNQQAVQMDDFADRVIKKRKTGVPGELGRRDIRIIESIYEAARTGKRVKIGF